MRITLSDPVGSLINLDAQTCPREGDPVLVRGKKYFVKKVRHEVHETENLGYYMTTIVDVDLQKPED